MKQLIILFFLLVFVSCKEKAVPVYYLQFTENCDSAYCVNIVDQDNVIIVVLDRNTKCHSNFEEVIEACKSQRGFTSTFTASNAYWDLLD